jgi:hypothetical protein
LWKVARHSDIERAVLATCQHVDAGVFIHGNRSNGFPPSRE